jgi:hypothetical protein
MFYEDLAMKIDAEIKKIKDIVDNDVKNLMLL